MQRCRRLRVNQICRDPSVRSCRCADVLRLSGPGRQPSTRPTARTKGTRARRGARLPQIPEQRSSCAPTLRSCLPQTPSADDWMTEDLAWFGVPACVTAATGLTRGELAQAFGADLSSPTSDFATNELVSFSEISGCQVAIEVNARCLRRAQMS